MITERDLAEAIAECQGKRNPDSNTCIKLAAFYTIRNELFGSQDRVTPSYSYSPSQTNDSMVTIAGDSDFAKRINGKRQEDVWSVIDELMDTLRVMQPRLYRMVMDNLNE